MFLTLSFALSINFKLIRLLFKIMIKVRICSKNELVQFAVFCLNWGTEKEWEARLVSWDVPASQAGPEGISECCVAWIAWGQTKLSYPYIYTTVRQMKAGPRTKVPQPGGWALGTLTYWLNRLSLYSKCPYALATHKTPPLEQKAKLP